MLWCPRDKCSADACVLNLLPLINLNAECKTLVLRPSWKLLLVGAELPGAGVAQLLWAAAAGPGSWKGFLGGLVGSCWSEDMREGEAWAMVAGHGSLQWAGFARYISQGLWSAASDTGRSLDFPLGWASGLLEQPAA